jgi:hypothetical protein
MRNQLVYANLYAHLYAHRAKQAAINTKEYALAHQSELKCIGATSVVVGLAARAAGFKAGYEFAKTSNVPPTV